MDCFCFGGVTRSLCDVPLYAIQLYYFLNYLHYFSLYLLFCCIFLSEYFERISLLPASAAPPPPMLLDPGNGVKELRTYLGKGKKK